MDEFEEVLARFLKARNEYQIAFNNFNRASLDLEKAFGEIQKELDKPEEVENVTIPET
jgi:hypothetical protein